MKKTGLLGGSFDPVHLAHVALAETALRELALDEMQLLPAADPWQRPRLGATPAQRLAMLRLAVRDKPGLVVNPVEIQRGGKTYTIDTLEQLPDDTEYHWVLGSDQLANFCTWHRWQDIARRVTLTVAQRPDAPAQAPQALQALLDELGRPLVRLPFAPMQVSASEIRRRLAAALPVDGLLDVAVAQYISQNRLYDSPGDGPDTL